MRAPLSNCKSPTYFFKFIKPGLMSQLSIPISFRKYIKCRRNNKTAILKRGSRKWYVKIIDWAFDEGWDKFVRQNGVKDFDIIVFKHEGNMVFNTMVFDNTKSWCEREYINNQVTESSKKCKIETNAPKKMSKEKDTVSDHIYHRYFNGTLKSAHCKYRLSLPINFTRSNGLRSGEMVLRNGQSQMSWTVDLTVDLKKGSRIGRGWHDFYIANGLKEGDRFKLELIQTGIKPIANFYNLSTKQSESHGMMRSRYFVGTLKDYGNSRKHMYIRRKFALENGLRSGELVLKSVETEGSWTVNLRNHMGKYYYIQNGLEEFCTANGLEKGDNFRFELIQNGNKQIATISRM